MKKIYDSKVVIYCGRAKHLKNSLRQKLVIINIDSEEKAWGKGGGGTQH